MKKLLSLLPLSAALVLCPNLHGQEHDRWHNEHRDDRRHLYDKHQNDYHDFDQREDRAWRMYWQERRHSYVNWDRASERQRQDYWNWRHSHSDAALQINIR